MSRLFALLTALVLLLAPVAARSQDEVAALNGKALAALTAGKFDEGIGYLERVLELRPKDNGTAYNLACAHSLKADVDKAFEWMDKALEWGWGTSEGTLVNNTTRMSHLDMTKNDPDLENMRKDPRYDALIERMAKAEEVRKTRVKAAEAYAAAASVYIPEKVAAMAEMPVLVVVHDLGSNKAAIVSEKSSSEGLSSAGAMSKNGVTAAHALQPSVDWKKVADELGFALIAPSGKFLVGDDPAQGMAWFDTEAEYVKKAWSYEKPIVDAYSAFKKEHKVDKARVFLCGEGITGGLVAINAAISNPGYFKGVVALGGTIHPQLMGSKAPTAGKMGLKVKLLADVATMKKLLKDPADADKAVASWNKSLETWGVQGAVAPFERDEKDPDHARKLVVEALKAMLAAADKPAQAAAPVAPTPPSAPPK